MHSQGSKHLQPDSETNQPAHLGGILHGQICKFAYVTIVSLWSSHEETMVSSL